MKTRQRVTRPHPKVSDRLADIRMAFREQPTLPNLLLDPDLLNGMVAREKDLRSVVRDAAQAALPAPCFTAALSYFNAYRSPWMPGNLIQAQRHYFGSHAYQRIDVNGTFQADWTQV
jgi:6-phosphogluconate dehydrogenase